ncbi:MAG TPA: hypothetical protein VLE97_10700 [Gaiellaceae bacterium]|nr:hypothetical protein [Gaiellaceae bacterium]
MTRLQGVDDAAARLRAIYTKHLQPHLRAQLDPAALVEAREAYASVPAAEQRAAYWGYQRRGVTLSEVPPTATAARFYLGDDEKLVELTGWDQGQTWNGWAVPRVDRQQLEVLVAALSAIDDSQSYRLVGDVLHVVDAASPDEASTVESSMVACDDGQVRALYDVGLGFTWSIESEPAELGATP